MIENKTNWNYSEFRIYLLLYVANTDLELTEEEKEMILSKATTNEYIHVRKVFEKDSDIEQLETILSFREKYFATDNEIDKITNEIVELFDTEEQHNPYERNFIRLLIKLLKNN